MGLLMTGVLAVIVANNQYLRNSEARMMMQREALMSLSQMTRELTETDRYAINVDTDGVVFASPRNLHNQITFDPRGRLQWWKYVCYYRANFGGNPCLIRKVVALPTPATDVPPAPTVASVRDDPTLTPKVLAQYVDSFTPTLTAAGPVDLDLVVKKKHYGRTYGMEIKSKVYMRN